MLEKKGVIEDSDGKVVIAEDVVAAIAGIAASEVEGLGGMKSSVSEGIVGIFGGRQKGVETKLTNGTVTIDLNVAISYGQPIREVAKKIQERVKSEVEEMSGLQVEQVNIHVRKIELPEEEFEEGS